jgi:hypothetical protein
VKQEPLHKTVLFNIFAYTLYHDNYLYKAYYNLCRGDALRYNRDKLKNAKVFATHQKLSYIDKKKSPVNFTGLYESIMKFTELTDEKAHGFNCGMRVRIFYG